MPLHRLRHWQRGYNQSALIANYLAHWLKIPCDHDFLQRIKHTHTQRGLSATERRKIYATHFVFIQKAKRIAINLLH